MLISCYLDLECVSFTFLKLLQNTILMSFSCMFLAEIDDLPVGHIFLNSWQSPTDMYYTDQCQAPIKIWLFFSVFRVTISDKS